MIFIIKLKREYNKDKKEDLAASFCANLMII